MKKSRSVASVSRVWASSPDVRTLALLWSDYGWRTLATISALGWLVLAFAVERLFATGLCGSLALAWIKGGRTAVEQLLLFNPPLSLAGAWLLMLVAMMPPLLASPLHYIWQRSLRRHQVAAIATFTLGYVGVWMLAGIGIGLLAISLRVLFVGNTFAVLVAALAIVLAWYALPLRQYCLNRCHYRPRIDAFGWRAYRACFRFGCTAGFWCVGVCWPLMHLPYAVDRGHLPLMLLASAVLMLDRLRRPKAALWGFSFPALRTLHTTR